MARGMWVTGELGTGKNTFAEICFKFRAYGMLQGCSGPDFANKLKVGRPARMFEMRSGGPGRATVH